MTYLVGIAGLDALNWAAVRTRLFGLFRGAGRLSSVLGRGQALDETIRMRMEPALGYDLKDVRIHQTKQAGRLARALEAEAFTIGAHIFTAEGKLDALSRQSRGLLAHELTHVIQQTHPQPVPYSCDIQSLRRHGAPGGDALSMVPGHAEPQAPPLQPASTGEYPWWGNSAADAMETEAQSVEDDVRGEQTPSRRSQVTAVDAEEVAEIVYRLMQNELSMERDRVGR